MWGTSPARFSPYKDFTGTKTIPVPQAVEDTPVTNLPYPFDDRPADQYSGDYDDSPLYLDDPSNVNSSIEYDPVEKQYNINESIGDFYYRNPNYLTFEEFKEKEFDNSTRKYWRQRAGEDDILQKKGFNPKIYVGSDVFDRIFGGNTIDIRPQGSAELIFGLNIQTNQNPAIPENQRTSTTFDFQEKIQMSVIGNIGEKMKLQVNYNTEASFDFENKMKLEYSGKEDEIIQKIEAGNVSLPLSGSLIQGSQSLFGLKTQLKFGRMKVTSVFSQQKGQRSTINVPPGGGQITEYEILCDEYEANKHFFLSQYFMQNYDKALSNLPTITSPFTITKLEVWKTNRSARNESNRDVVAFMDLGEYNFYATNFIGQGTSVYPSDSLSNDLYNKMTKQLPFSGIRDVNQAASILGGLGLPPTNFSAQQDYVIIRNAVKLNPSDYTFNERLGFISLNSALNPDEELAIAFEYTISGNVYRVGELSTTGIDPTQTLIVKLIRSKAVSPRLPTWDLMMKNVYSLQGYQISRENFKLNIFYADDKDGGKKKRYISEPADPVVSNTPLIRLLNLDNLNTNGDPAPGGDGVFDFVEGVTINTQNGRIYFPEREPFGVYLESKFVDQQTGAKYSYRELYDSTLTIAQQFANKNKFSIEGSYQSASGAEISLNAINIPQGAVTVTAGGQTLVENQDYTVDYNLGRVKIINAGLLASNTPIQVSVESQSLFSIQSKTLIGARFDFEANKDLTIGGTFLHLNERPITQKVNIGDEPISNTIWGLDGTYRKESRFITKMIDKIPFIETKEPSNVTFSGEFAQFMPGHSSAIGSQGNAYIDDFEGSQSTIDIRNPGNWFLASTPQGQSVLFPETQGSFIDSLKYGYNRAKFAWYTIDPSVFYRGNSSLLPPNITDADLANNNVRAVLEKEVFPNKQNQQNINVELPILNLGFYPDERGPYNFDVEQTSVSDGIDADGKLVNPESRWGGIMRRIETSDFEASNVEFIQFWMMDPFHSENINGTIEGGQLYFNLGNIAEDILSDGHQFFENGMPTTGQPTLTVDSSSWGLYPLTDDITKAFVNDLNNANQSRIEQDIGLDGLNTAAELAFHQDYFSRLNGVPGMNASVIADFQQDPSADNFHYFRGSDYDSGQLGILDRYKNFNGPDGNSNPESPQGYPISATTIPDNEDINRDYQTEFDENYNQYVVDLDPTNPILSSYVVDEFETTVQTAGNTTRTVKWYQFRIPINKPDEVIGLGANMKSVNFIRMFMKGWTQPIILRIARLDLLRGEWRRYPFELETAGSAINLDDPEFNVSVVNIEENGKRDPIPYVLPPGIEREIAQNTTNQQQLNEQSLSLRLCNLEDGEERAAYKTTQFDVRNYKKIRMYIHTEDINDIDDLQDKDVTLFVRMGTDFSNNYYEYEVPLRVSRHGVSRDVDIWLDSLDIDIEKLTNAKLNREKQGVAFTTRYIEIDGQNRIAVKGNPTLSFVKTLMIGVRNYAVGSNPYQADSEDDGQAKCVEIWVNELRMSQFNEEGGWAANARVQTKLADFGNVTLSGSRSTYGFGQLESKIQERQQDNRTAFDITSSLELGKFFPEKTGISVPMYIGYGQEVAKPEYNPLDPDIRFDDALNAKQTDEERENLKKITEDYTRRKSINFTNVKKNRTGGGGSSKPKVYDIENFNVSYGYSETYRRNVNTEYDLLKDYTGSIGYNYNAQSKGISPFAKSKGLKSKYAKPIKDFNFNPIPSNFSFRTDIARHYQEVKLRNINDEQYSPPPTYDKRFLMTRQYSFTWDITRSIKLDFDANNIAKIDEPEGALDTKAKRDSMWENFWNLGRNTDYRHSGTLSYNVPLNKFPITDWINVNARYGFEYHWMASSLIYDPFGQPRINPALGNTIENSNDKQINTTFALTTLYNKVPLLKKLLGPVPPKAKTPPKPKTEIQVAPQDTAGGKKPKLPKEKKEKQYSPLVRGIAKFIFSVKNFSINYTETKGTLLPGFTRSSEILGNNLYKDADGKSSYAPGFGFAFGEQDPNFKYKAAENGWITRDSTLNNQLTNTLTQNLTARSSAEPLPGLKIDLNANRTFAKNHSEYFRTNSNQEFTVFNSIDAGNFNISWLTIGTAFTKDNDDYTNDVFTKFDENRKIISQRLATLNGFSNGSLDSAGYVDGYGATSQEVLTYSFIAAYSGQDVNSIKIGTEKSLFPKTPKPNWRVTYDGLSKIPLFKKIFQSVSITHAYRSSLNINSYSTSLLYKSAGGARNQVGNFIPQYEVAQISISEQFSPLLGVDVTWKNKLSTRVEYKKDRSLSLSYAGVQLTEIKGNEITVGAGYRFKPKFPIKLGGKRLLLTNDMNITADFSFRRNSTILRKLQERINQPTAGLNVFSIKLGADYTINERMNIRAFFERTSNEPLISTSFPTTNTQFGISLRFTLAQ